ncbi:hypothetical protein [Streptomyces avicenniae]|uniref:hypothetical protein n=1 Tax=Streptomyces avicenniae TaxID=500153 RepID=UPI00069C744C|nr:hypothetical protein [Streptomyces avicenniae]
MIRDEGVLAMEDRDTQFRGNVEPPRRPRPSAGRVLGGLLLGLVIAAALAGALLLGRPALDVERQHTPQAPEAAHEG